MSVHSTLRPARRRIHAITAAQLTRSQGLLHPNELEKQVRVAAFRVCGSASSATVQRYVQDALWAAPAIRAGISNQAYAAALRAAS